jgi:hypothetical protein
MRVLSCHAVTFVLLLFAHKLMASLKK